ncbi:HPr kinase/phosphorylase [Methylobacterium sp. A54F]
MAVRTARPAETVHATCHATCLAVGEAGVLIRGQAGVGKTALALSLLDRAADRGAALVGDDRIRLTRWNDRVVARPHPVISGQIEVRGVGLEAVAFEPAAVLRLVVDLVAVLPRLPETSGPADILGIALPRLLFETRHVESGVAASLILTKLGVAAWPHLAPETARQVPPGSGVPFGVS